MSHFLTENNLILFFILNVSKEQFFLHSGDLTVQGAVTGGAEELLEAHEADFSYAGLVRAPPRCSLSLLSRQQHRAPPSGRETATAGGQSPGWRYTFTLTHCTVSTLQTDGSDFGCTSRVWLEVPSLMLSVCGGIYCRT